MTHTKVSDRSPADHYYRRIATLADLELEKAWDLFPKQLVPVAATKQLTA